MIYFIDLKANSVHEKFSKALDQSLPMDDQSALGPRCRFYPTCSHYAIEAIDRHGAWRGTRLAFKRLVKCHPFHEGGLDPVPETEQQG